MQTQESSNYLKLQQKFSDLLNVVRLPQNRSGGTQVPDAKTRTVVIA